MVWLDERPAHANSELGLYWTMGIDVGLDQYGGALAKTSARNWQPINEVLLNPDKQTQHPIKVKEIKQLAFCKLG